MYEEQEFYVKLFCYGRHKVFKFEIELRYIRRAAYNFLLKTI